MKVPTGKSTAVMIGRVLVITNDEAVFGTDPETGEKLWTLPPASMRVSSDLIVLLEHEHDQVKAFSVADPATGRILWRKDPVGDLRVTEDAIFSIACRKKDECTTTRHDRRSGEPRWSVRSGDSSLNEDGVGARMPFTPATGSYLLSELREDDRGFSVGARDTKSGRLVRGRVVSGWHEVAIGRTLVSSEHDPPEDDDRCTVTLTAVDAESGRKKWKREVFGGRTIDGDCHKRLSDAQSGHFSFIGSGSRIAASTEDGHPQVFDLATGRTVWRGDAEGVPIDGDGRTLLVRRHADEGSLALLDFATGRPLWTAPDPGLEGSSASWQTAVTSRLVAVSGAVGTRPHVLVHRVGDGQRLGLFPGWLQGLGDDWAAIGHSPDPPSAHSLQFDFIRF